SIARWPTNPYSYDPVTLQPKNYNFLNSVKNLIFQSDNVLEGQRDDQVNILLLGMGGTGHDGPYLTDTNMVASLKPSTKEVALLSIPRDLGVKMDSYGLGKINHANAYGENASPGQGGEYARKIFSETLGVDIPHYIRVDFKAFVDIIDAVNGITINVERAFSDYMFPGENDSYQTIQFIAGPQQMDGARALEYARSRHGTNGEGSDFARARRQQQVLAALKEKLLSFGTYTNPLKVQKILESLSNHISTNLDFGQIMYLAALYREVHSYPRALVLDNGPNGYLYSANSPTAGYILLPNDGNFDEIRNAFENIFGDIPLPVALPPQTVSVPEQNTSSTIFESAKIEVQNGTWVMGLASRMEKRLTESGFTVNNIGNSSQRPFPLTTIYLINPDVSREILSSLSMQLAAPIEKTLPDWLKAGYNTSTASSVGEEKPKYNPDTDILIILGEDTNE
ncbi:MAG TPA: LCP family protein, partial [Patescibacteria group bacterium]|nr:LCP family protein [Patescibacteria group bacterium]